MKNLEWVGWLSSMILVATLIRQVMKQYKTDQSKGVSLWMFIGQMAAQIGFIVYSIEVKNWVFIVTNSVLFFVSVFGLSLVIIHRRRARV